MFQMNIDKRRLRQFELATYLPTISFVKKSIKLLVIDTMS